MFYGFKLTSRLFVLLWNCQSVQETIFCLFHNYMSTLNFFIIFCLRDKTCVGDYQNVHLDKMPYMFSSLEWCCCSVCVCVVDIVV